MKEIEDNLLNVNQLRVILNKLHECLTDDENEVIHALASDAATVKPRGTENNAINAIQAQPFNSKYKCQIIHVAPNKNGRFTQEYIDTFEIVRNLGIESKFDFECFSTDGDKKTNLLHNNFYEFIQKKNFDFDLIINDIKEYELAVPNSDLLHLLKGMRREYNNNNILMTLNSTIINKNNERQILQMSSMYRDEVEISTSCASMRDDLSLFLFNTENLYLLGLYGHFSFFAFQLISVIMLSVIQAKHLTSQARYTLFKTNN